MNPLAFPAISPTYYFGLIDTTGSIPGMVNYLDTLTVLVSCTDIDELYEDHYGKMYPNPANTTVYCEAKLAPYEIGSLELFDILGNLVYSIPLRTGVTKTELDISGLSAGVYLYKIFIDNEFRSSDKLIITK